jgi:hypothetical protein
MEENADKLDWVQVSMYQQMSLPFIIKHQKQINFRYLSMNPYLTFEILDKFSSKISWSMLSMNGRALSESMMFNYRNKVIWELILSHQQLRLEFLIHMSEVMRKSRAKTTKMFWRAISRFQKLNKVYIDTYKRYIDFNELSKNEHLTEDIMDAYFDKLDLKLLFSRHLLSNDFILRHGKAFKEAIDSKPTENK